MRLLFCSFEAMFIDELYDYCLSLNGTEAKLPFGPETLVFTVCDKIFCLAGLEPFEKINIKCDPDNAILLRENYNAVTPGFHMNKKHWNTVLLGNDASDLLVKQWILDSYQLVVAKLPKAKKQELLGE